MYIVCIVIVFHQNIKKSIIGISVEKYDLMYNLTQGEHVGKGTL